MSFSQEKNRKDILGIGVDDISTEHMRELFRSWISELAFVSIVTPNPEFVLLSYKNDSWKEIIQRATLSLPDGVGLQFASMALTGKQIEHRQTGVDAVKELCTAINERGGKVLLVGDDEHGDHGLGALGIARKMLELMYPQIHFMSVDPGRLARAEFPIDLVRRACDEQLTAVFVALPMPFQLNAIELHERLGFKGIVMGIGGALDMMSGIMPRAPRSWQNMGLEWLWRFSHEPRRYKRMYRALIVFPCTIAYTVYHQGNLLAAIKRVTIYLITRTYVRN